MVSEFARRAKRHEDLSGCRLLVTPTSFAKGNPDFKSTLEKTVGEVIYNPYSRPLASGELAELLKDVDGMIAGLDQIDAPAPAAAGYSVSLVALDQLLASSDVVSLHTAVTSANAGMVNADFLHKMRPGALLINTARGELIDEAALQEALEKKRLAGAALDCFCKEPPGAGASAAADASNYCHTPHGGPYG
jgi:phosphoglycerate dehydrogenase-like enzyme